MNYFDVINGYTSDVAAGSSDVTPSPRGSDSGIESDCADCNLSWLLNYKIQELPPVPDAAVTENAHTISSSEITANSTVSEEDVKVANQQRYSGPKKPPFTYTELIEHALSEKGELTVSGIYHWISDHFPFYKQNDDRWKNSVRHNLSINPHFRKGGKAVHGAGHLWTIAQKDDNKTWKMKQRIQQFLQSTTNRKDRKTEEQEAFDNELQAATQSILGEIGTSVTNQFERNHLRNDKAFPFQVTETNDEIHVEFINVTETPNGLEDFLSPPVPQQDLVNECGLGGDFFITDIDPNTLGLNLAGGGAADDIIYDEMSFEYYGMK